MKTIPFDYKKVRKGTRVLSERFGEGKVLDKDPNFHGFPLTIRFASRALPLIYTRWGTLYLSDPGSPENPALLIIKRKSKTTNHGKETNNRD